MAAVEVRVVAWLAWGVVAGLLGVVGGDSGAFWGRLESLETPHPKQNGQKQGRHQAQLPFGGVLIGNGPGTKRNFRKKQLL